MIERVDDLATLLAVSRSVGWPHTAEDWRTVIAAGPVFGHHAPTGELLSSAAVFPYGPALASIGMVLVRPEAQRRGLASDLVRHCVAALGTPAPPVTLIATQAGYPVYRRLGFEMVDRIVKLVAPAGAGERGHAAGEPGRPAIAHLRAPLVAADLHAIATLDADAAGADRRAMLAARIAQAGGACLACDADAAPIGYAIATRQHEWLVVGPVVAADPALAAALVAHVRAGHAGPVRIDVPVEATALIGRLRAGGFEPADEAPVMLLGARTLPGRRERVGAVATRGFA